MSPEAEAVARVAEYRQRARLDEWVTYAASPLDRRNPVAALVRGWELEGLVELREEAGPPGQPWHHCRPLRLQFCRLEADFPPGWNDPLPRLAQPPSKRDPKAVGIGWMAHWAGQGDERPEWLRYAASHYRDRLGRLGAALSEALLVEKGDRVPLAKDDLREAGKLLAEAGLVLMTFEQMLNPTPADAFPTNKRLEVVARPITAAEKARDVAAGRKPRRSRMTMERLRRASVAAAEVKREQAAGLPRWFAVKEAAAKHHVAQGDVGARLAYWAAWERRPADLALARAVGIASALQRGGLLQAAALGLAAELTGLAPADIRKALKG